MNRGCEAAVAAAFLIGTALLGGAFARTPAVEAQIPPQAESKGKTKKSSSTGSVTVPKSHKGGKKADEADALAQTAKISADQARSAPLGQFPSGTVKKVKLENEHGSVVDEMELTDTPASATIR